MNNDDKNFGIHLDLQRSYSKKEIEEIIVQIIERYLEETDSGTLYIFFKQLEYGVKIGVEYLKEQAFDSLGHHLGGLTSGKIQGHEVVISYPREWQFSDAVEDLKEQQKKELAELQDIEKASGIARQVMGKEKITVTIRGQ